MALILSEDEKQFQDSVRRLVAERSPLSKLRELMSSGQPYDADAWKQLSALGLTGLVVPAELGHGLVSSPLLAGTLAAATLGKLGDAGAAARLLPGIASGEQVVTVALGAGTATADGDTLTGDLSPVLNAAQAEVLLVPVADGAGTVVFEVAASAPGVTTTAAAWRACSWRGRPDGGWRATRRRRSTSRPTSPTWPSRPSRSAGWRPPWR
jgi:hypothetical protein